MENKIENAIQELEENGFTMFRGLFSEGQAQKAHDELDYWYNKDLELRAANNVSEPHWKSEAGQFVLTKPSHLMIDAYTKSPELDRMFEVFLTSPETRPVIQALAGKNIKLRGFNIRKMTGAYNPPPAHEWHRDSIGEFGFGILLTDIEPGENAATSFVPGSHLFPYCARWNNLFYTPTKMLPFFQKYGPFNKLLGKKVLKDATSAWGKKGDAYIFINDTWHGREPNLHGKKSMVVLIGAFATEYEFPDTVTPPPEPILRNLPPELANVASCNLPPNQVTDTILRRILRKRMKTGIFTLWRAAQIERKIGDYISLPFIILKKLSIHWEYYWGRAVIKVKKLSSAS